MTEHLERPLSCPLGGAASDAEPIPPEYVSYAHMDRLHELAHPRTESAQELSFILLSHVKELLFRMAYVDLGQARSQLRADRVEQACRALERMIRTQRILVTTWEGMNAIAPDEFLAFRDVLGDASGIQSYMYRTLEFAMGNKDPDMVRLASAFIDLYPDLRAELGGPSLYDETLRFLARRGFPVPQQLLTRDFEQPYAGHLAVEDVWLTIYRSPAAYPAEYRIAELLTEVAYQFSHWRATHLLVVERKLGRKPGTGGTEGLDWLRTVNDHRFFPELWSMRTRL
ncbi:tryptophan 2,3-dioxygenase [Nocardia sp. CA-135953]|uniref:tryptophan 2,3-dioxygenase n=1 Tax=Nocardia sp. CA-135953 TaxID=3239978 RepID=UPI003D95FD0A